MLSRLDNAAFKTTGKTMAGALLLMAFLIVAAPQAHSQQSGAEDGKPQMRGPLGLIKRVWKAPRVSQNPNGDGSHWTIEADETEVLKDQNKYIGRGHVQVYIDGQDARLSADEATFDQSTSILDVKGGVRIERKGMTTTGSHYRFKISSDEYLVTNPGAAPSDLNLFSRDTKRRGTK